MNTTDPITAERTRSDAWHAEQADLAKRLPLSPPAARALAFAILTEFLSALTSTNLGALYSTRLADVVLLVADIRRALYPSRDEDPWSAFPSIGLAADRLHARMFNAPGARGTWPEELRLPAEAALAVRYACEADALRFVPLLYTLARASLTRCAMPTARLEGLLEEAERAAHADLVTGLDGLVQEAAAATKDDVVLHALHVACGAQAVDAIRRKPDDDRVLREIEAEVTERMRAGVVSPAEAREQFTDGWPFTTPEDPHAVARGELCQPGRHRLGCPHELGDAPQHSTPEERAWCERVSGRARAGAYASTPIVGHIDGKPVPVRGSP